MKVILKNAVEQVKDIEVFSSKNKFELTHDQIKKGVLCQINLHNHKQIIIKL